MKVCSRGLPIVGQQVPCRASCETGPNAAWDDDDEEEEEEDGARAAAGIWRRGYMDGWMDGVRQSRRAGEDEQTSRREGNGRAAMT